MAPVRVLCIGEAMAELSEAGAAPDGAPLLRLGVAGDTMNTAVFLARAAGEAAQVDYVTALGRDRWSDRIAGFMAAEGVGTGRIRRLPDQLPGLYAIDTDAEGERSFSYWRSRSAARQMFGAAGAAPDFSALEGAELLYLSAITLAILPPDIRAALIARLGALRAAGARIAFDSNWRPALWESRAAGRDAVSALWAITDIPLPSADDEAALFGDGSEAETHARLCALCPGTGALKRGASGPAPLGGEAAIPTGGWPRVAPLDTTAAGDSFNGGYLAAILRGEGQGAAMAAGHALASRVVQVRGAIPPRGAKGPEAG